MQHTQQRQISPLYPLRCCCGLLIPHAPINWDKYSDLADANKNTELQVAVHASAGFNETARTGSLLQKMDLTHLVYRIS